MSAPAPAARPRDPRPPASPGRAPRPDQPWTADRRDAAIRELHLRFGPSLLGYVNRRTGDWHEAEDVVQETMVRAWRQIDRLALGSGSLWGWLTRVAHNIVVDRARARRSRPAEVEPVPGQEGSVDDHADAVVTAVYVAGALAALPPVHRGVLQQVYLDDRSVREAALALGVPVGTVKSRLHYAMAGLRLVLAADGAGSPPGIPAPGAGPAPLASPTPRRPGPPPAIPRSA